MKKIKSGDKPKESLKPKYVNVAYYGEVSHQGSFHLTANTSQATQQNTPRKINEQLWLRYVNARAEFLDLDKEIRFYFRPIRDTRN